MPKKETLNEAGKPVFSVERVMENIRERCLSIPKSKARAIIIAGSLISAAIIAAVSLLSFIPQWLNPFITFPIGLFIFLVALYYVHQYQENNPDKLTIKERWSFKSRIKIFAIIGVVYTALLLLASQYIPNALGGVITIAVIFGMYNVIRPSPDEIALAELGLADPRDGDMETVPTEQEQYFVPAETEYVNDEDYDPTADAVDNTQQTVQQETPMQPTAEHTGSSLFDEAIDDIDRKGRNSL